VDKRGDGAAPRALAAAGASARARARARSRSARCVLLAPTPPLASSLSPPPPPRPRVQEWCRASGAECLAPQYPGRAMRLSEPHAASAAALAAALLPVVASRLYDAPYAIIAHSVGTWVAYEFLRAAAAAGVPPPRVFILSAMPAPGLPLVQRPWRPQRALDEAAFVEECRGWDISEVVFSPAMWPAYQPLLRADFSLFDEYPEHSGGGANGDGNGNSDGENSGESDSAPFAFPLVAFWGTRDRRVTEAHVRGWARLAGGRFSAEAVDGNHLWPLERGAKAVWLVRVAEELGAALGAGGGAGEA
jgi:medium-chain acyl-[acyl-carrier-protein] hydrolase